MNRREKLEKMLGESPEDVFIQYALALEFASAGEDRAAADRLERLLEADAHYVPAYFQLAQIQVRQGGVDDARRTLTHGIEVARRAGDQHAEEEMRGFLTSLV
jgi:Tfp pilus assembly protein PilF